MKSEHIRWMILIVLALIWGSSFILMKKALIHLSPVQVGALRMIFTGMTLIPLGYRGLAQVPPSSASLFSENRFSGS